MQWELLKDLPQDDVRELLSIARRRAFAKREVVFHQDDPADSLHLVVEGRFAIRVLARRGDAVTIGVRGPGDSFGEMALVSDDARRAATVAALEPASTYAVYKDDFHRVRRRHPGVTDVLVAFLAGEVKRQNGLLVEALHVSAERRVLRRLVELAELYPEGEIGLTQEELAEMAGTSRATVNGVLRREQELGRVDLRRGRVVATDLTELRRQADRP
jgi:CRP/FNR family cyclic AMP-dependent transcriptional regulator